MRKLIGYCAFLGITSLAGVAIPGFARAETQQAQGILRAVHEATLSSELAAQIEQIPYREGMAFRQGDLLVSFNCALPRAEAEAARQEVRVKKSAWDTNIELDKFQSVGRYDLIAAEGEYRKALARAKSLEIQVSYCEIRAPFDGQVQALKVAPWEAVSAGQALLTIVDPGELELNIIVPSGWLTWLHPGSEFTFEAQESHSTSAGHITRVLPQIDAVSKTVKVIGVLDTEDGASVQFAPGMSGRVAFTEGREAAND